MPSNKIPGSATVRTSSAPAGVASGGAPAFVGGLSSHIADPVNAHAASAISYDGGPNWADATTNSEIEVEAAIDKIITDLSVGDGSGKIAQLAVMTWRDGAMNPATTLGDRIANLYEDLIATDGSDKIGNNAAGQFYNDGSFPSADNIGGTMREIVGDLGRETTGSSGANLIGCGARIDWFGGGKANGEESLFDAVDGIIDDLGLANNASDSGAVRVRSFEIVSTGSFGTVATGGVYSQLENIINNAGHLGNANTWTGLNEFTESLTLKATGGLDGSIRASGPISIESDFGSNENIVLRCVQSDDAAGVVGLTTTFSGSLKSITTEHSAFRFDADAMFPGGSFNFGPDTVFAAGAQELPRHFNIHGSGGRDVTSGINNDGGDIVLQPGPRSDGGTADTGRAGRWGKRWSSQPAGQGIVSEVWEEHLSRFKGGAANFVTTRLQQQGGQDLKTVRPAILWVEVLAMCVEKVNNPTNVAVTKSQSAFTVTFINTQFQGPGVNLMLGTPDILVARYTPGFAAPITITFTTPSGFGPDVNAFAPAAATNTQLDMWVKWYWVA